MTWRYVFYDLRSGDLLGEPASVPAWTHTDTLDPMRSSWAATIAPRPTELDGSLYRNITRIGRTNVVALRDGVPQFSGIVHAAAYDLNRGQLRMSGGGLASYLNGFAQTDKLRYAAGTDQFDIARALVAVVQDLAGGDIGIQVDTETSGVTRKRVYQPFSGNTIGQLLSNLSHVIDGFDWTITTVDNAGTLERRLTLWYPRRGRTAPETGVAFRYPSPNVTDCRWTHTAPNQAMEVTALGAGDGNDRLSVTVTDSTLIDAGWPAYRTVRTYRDVSRLSTLTGHADDDLAMLSGLESFRHLVTVNPADRGTPFGSWELGDDCTLTVDDDPVLAGTVDRRIVGHRWNVAGHVTETLQVTLTQLGVSE